MATDVRQLFEFDLREAIKDALIYANKLPNFESLNGDNTTQRDKEEIMKHLEEIHKES